MHRAHAYNLWPISKVIEFYTNAGPHCTLYPCRGTNVLQQYKHLPYNDHIYEVQAHE